MLKTRIIPVLLYKDGSIVKGKGFDSWRRIGPPIPAVRVHNMRGVDELVFLDIGATPEGREPDFDLIADVADECHMPLAIGGGIRTVEHCREALLAGADKVIINTAAVEDPSLIERASRKLGSQSITVSIDVRNDDSIATRCGLGSAIRECAAWAKNTERYGAGELLLGSVPHDGTLEGYRLDLIQAISEAVSIPVIAVGGAGTYEHFAQALDAGAHAVAAGAMFQFTEQTPQGAAEYLDDRGYRVRHERPNHRRVGNLWPCDGQASPF